MTLRAGGHGITEGRVIISLSKIAIRERVRDVM
jgi:hypothetical protein